MFNYASFCKVLSTKEITCSTNKIVKDYYKSSILAREIFRLFMSQISSLKALSCGKYHKSSFIIYPKDKDLLKIFQHWSVVQTFTLNFIVIYRNHVTT